MSDADYDSLIVNVTYMMSMSFDDFRERDYLPYERDYLPYERDYLPYEPIFMIPRQSSGLSSINRRIISIPFLPSMQGDMIAPSHILMSNGCMDTFTHSFADDIIDNLVNSKLKLKSQKKPKVYYQKHKSNSILNTKRKYKPFVYRKN